MTRQQAIRFSSDECITLRQVELAAEGLRDRVIHKPMAKIDLEILRDYFKRTEEKAQRSVNLINQAIQTLEQDDNP